MTLRDLRPGGAPEVGSQEINSNGTNTKSALSHEWPDGNGNQWAAVMASIKQAVTYFSDIIFIECLSGNTISSLSELLDSDFLTAYTQATKYEFLLALNSGWLYGLGLDRSIRRISYAVQAQIYANL